MEFQNTNLKVLVGNATSDAAETTLSAFKASGSVGEVIATDSKGSVVASGTTKFMIALKNADGTLDTTEIMDLSNVKTISAKAYSPAFTKVSAIGYNGSTGAIDVINDNLYQINLELLNYGSLSPENRYLRQAHFQSPSSSTTQNLVADGLAASLIRNFSREQIARVLVERLCSAAGQALGTGVDNVTFTKGSKYFTATNIDDATTNAALVVGSYIRIGTATNSPVYKITAIDATTNVGTLDVPYQGPTTTIADTGLEQILIADAQAANCGLQISAVDQPFVVGKIRFEPLDWRPITLVDFGSTEVTELRPASKGIGDGRRVAELEWFAQGNFAERHRMGEPHLYDYRSELKADSNSTYDVLVIDYYVNQTAGMNIVSSSAPRTVMVFCDSDNSHASINGLIGDLNKSSLFSISTL